MNRALVSIIVPVYNVSAYLDKCVQSLVNQTYKNLEILLIDDGSTDTSGLICDSFAEQDSRVNVFHTKNQGQGTARNLGIKESRGDYIAFVDSDDYLGDTHFEKALKQIKKNDILCTGYTKITTNGYITECRSLPSYQQSKYILFSVCCKLFKQQFILNNNLKFQNTNLGEDIIFSLRALSLTNQVAISDLNDYFYITNINSTTHIVYKHLDNKIQYIFKEINEIINENPYYLKQDRHLVSFAIIKMALFLIQQTNKNQQTSSENYVNIINQAFQIIHENRLGSPQFFRSEKYTTNYYVIGFWLLKKAGLSKLALKLLSHKRK